MSGSSLTNWGVFGNSLPHSEAVIQAPSMAVEGSGDATKLLRKGWSPKSPGAYCKSFLNMTEADIQKVCALEPTALDYVPEFAKRNPWSVSAAPG